MLRASFVRVAGERDRIYVTRSNGSQVSWVFPTYGDGLPHDLVHLVVETAFGVRRGFWGRVDEGADPGRISADANRKGGKDKYTAYGDDQAELLLAEALAAALTQPAPTAASVREICETQGVAAPTGLSDAEVRETRDVLAQLQERWRGLLPKGALDLVFDPGDPERGFSELMTAFR